MLEPPDLSDDVIVATVREHYGIPVASLTFLPLGRDSQAWSYRARTADGAAYFVKLRMGEVNPAGLLVPRFLRDRGATGVVAPIPARTRALSVAVDAYDVTLYPFVEGVTGADRGMDERHWVSYGAALRQIHTTAPDADLTRQMMRETFTPASGAVQRVEAQIAAQAFEGPTERELAAFWRDRRTEIRALVDRAEALGRRLRAEGPPLVICHADIHTWNLLIDEDDGLWIVDWDDVVLAPKECDLMFVVGGLSRELVGPREEAWFFAGYGETSVGPLALAYYRYARAVDEIGAFAEQGILMPGLGEVTRRDSMRLLRSLFDPGNIVALAYDADAADL
jgi:spectinomycin phosphotransferase